jgi:hypothetical protein
MPRLHTIICRRNPWRDRSECLDAAEPSVVVPQNTPVVPMHVKYAK